MLRRHELQSTAALSSPVPRRLLAIDEGVVRAVDGPASTSPARVRAVVGDWRAGRCGQGRGVTMRASCSLVRQTGRITSGTIKLPSTRCNETIDLAQRPTRGALCATSAAARSASFRRSRWPPQPGATWATRNRSQSCGTTIAGRRARSKLSRAERRAITVQLFRDRRHSMPEQTRRRLFRQISGGLRQRDHDRHAPSCKAAS